METKITNYQSPKVDVIDVRAQSIICLSAETANVSNPWAGNVETEW